MKSRTVVLTIEIETAEPLAEIRKSTEVYVSSMKLDIVQLQANVIKPVKPAPKGKR